jgi:hypothetical protein
MNIVSQNPLLYTILVKRIEPNFLNIVLQNPLLYTILVKRIEPIFIKIVSQFLKPKPPSKLTFGSNPNSSMRVLENKSSKAEALGLHASLKIIELT